ncbi:MAG TPA: aldo/keto reductase [Streptosporangiaceae bacterium]|jgi:aryl-alcohol dehydrogenase-like predicted oxidoreductase|nr:aldo/keto reductase [Streptosporangiaceae bacterium]
MNGRKTTAAAAGTIDAGGDLTVNRLGYGAMRITGPLPWAPVQEADASRAVLDAADQHGATPRQIVLAWMLARSTPMLPIPGSGSPEHVEQNVAAAGIELSPDEFTAITKGA